MFVTLLVTACMYGPVPDQKLEARGCETVKITDSSADDRLTLMGCMVNGQAATVKWVSEHATYHSWYVKDWKCQIGRQPTGWKGDA